LPWKGGEFEPDLSLVLALYAREFFSVFEGLSDFQDRISPFLVNTSLKRVFEGIYLIENREQCLIDDEICL